MTKSWVKVGLGAAAFVAAACLGAFLISRGLNQAGTWATVLGLPIAILSAAAGIWSATLAARTLREARSPAVPTPPPLRTAHVELVDAAVDPDVFTGAGVSEATGMATASLTAEFAQVRPELGALDFKFINRGDAVAVLHQFTISILDFRLDTTPLLEYSYFPAGNTSSANDLYYGTALELKFDNFGWGSALGFSAALTCPILNDLFRKAALSIHFAEIASGEAPTFTVLAEDADRAAMDRLLGRRAALVEEAITALAEVDEGILQDADFTVLLSFHEQWHIREFFSDYPHAGGESVRQRWHRDYIAALDSDYIPIDLSMHIEYTDQDGQQKTEDTVALTSFDRSMTKGESWIGPAGLQYKVHRVSFAHMLSEDAYAVILDPENPGERNYRISRSVASGDADRFHVILASSTSGDFLLQLCFHFNSTQIVPAKPLLISLKHPRNARLPAAISDGASFELRHGRLELGTGLAALIRQLRLPRD